MSRTFRLTLVVGLFAVVAAACSSDEGADATTTSTVAAATTSSTTKAPVTTTTQPADAGASAMTFTGAECIQSGPTEVGSFVQFALRNDAPTDAVMMVLQITDVTLEELVSDNVERFPPIDSWPSTSGHAPEAVSTKFLESGEDGSLAVSFKESGTYGSVCYPLDGTAAILGSLFIVEV